MSSIYVYVVVDSDNRTLVHRQDQNQALRNLRYFRSIGQPCALILETTTSDGWRLKSEERTLIAIGDELPAESAT